MNRSPVVTVDTRSALEALCERVSASKRVGLDTEFHAERTYSARLMVVQIAFDDGAAVVDPLAVPDLRPLAAALADTVVVGHALSSDLKILAERFDSVPPHIFDTQVAAAFLGYGMQISLADLVRDLCKVSLAKSQTVSDWSARPLSPKQLDYLVDDVAYLLPMQDMLREKLQSAGRAQWVEDECAQTADIAHYRVDERRMMLRVPGSNRLNRRELGVLLQIVLLRDRLARDRDVPPKYIFPDDVLAGLAQLRPKRAEDLSQLRRLDSGMRRTFSDAILQAVRDGEAMPDADLPERPARPLGNARETLVALLGVALGEIARENDLPPSLIVQRAVLERAAREMPADRAAFETALGIAGWRLALVGEPLWRLLSGEANVSVEGYAQGDPKIHFSHDTARE